MNSLYSSLKTKRLATLSLIVLTALFMAITGVARAQVSGERTSEKTRKSLCLEKRRALADLEKEAADKRLEIRSAEDVLTKVRKSPDRSAVEERISNLSQKAQALREVLALLEAEAKAEDLADDERAEVKAMTEKKQEERSLVEQELKSWQDVLNDNPMSVGDSVGSGPAQVPMITTTLESKLSALRERQAVAGKQISFAQESMTSLKCDEMTAELASRTGDGGAGTTGAAAKRAPSITSNPNAATQPIPRQPGNPTVETPVSPEPSVTSSPNAATQPIPRQPGNPTVETPVSPKPGDQAVQSGRPAAGSSGATQPIPRQPGAATVATPRPTTPKPTVETPLPNSPTVTSPRPAADPTKPSQSGGVRPTLAGALVVALTVQQLLNCYQRNASPSDCALTLAGSLVAGGVITILSPTGAVVLTGVKGAFEIKDGIAELNRNWEDWKQRQDQDLLREGQLARNRRDRLGFDERIAALSARIRGLLRDKEALQSIYSAAGVQVWSAKQLLEQYRDSQRKSTEDILQLAARLKRDNADAKQKKAFIEAAAANAEQKERDVLKLIDDAIDLAKPGNCNAANRNTTRENYKQALNALGELGRLEKDVQKAHLDMKALSSNIESLQRELRKKIESAGNYLNSLPGSIREFRDRIDTQGASIVSSRLAQGVPNLRVEITMLRGAYQLPDESVKDEFRTVLNDLEASLGPAQVDPLITDEMSTRRAAISDIEAEAQRLLESFQAVKEPLQNADYQVSTPEEAVSRVGGVVMGLSIEVAVAGDKIANCISQGTPNSPGAGNIASAVAGVVTSDPVEELPEDKEADNANADRPPPADADSSSSTTDDNAASGKPPTPRSNDTVEDPPEDRQANNANNSQPPPAETAEQALCDVTGTWKGDYGIVRTYAQSGNTVTATTDYFFGWGMRHERLTGTLMRAGSGIKFELTTEFTEYDGTKGKGNYVMRVTCGADGKAIEFGNQTRVQQ